MAPKHFSVYFASIGILLDDGLMGTEGTAPLTHSTYTWEIADNRQIRDRKDFLWLSSLF